MKVLKILISLHTGKHLVFSKDPESVKDEFAFDNPGFRQEERTAWQHDAPTLPLGGKTHALHAEFTKPEQSKDDSHIHVSNTFYCMIACYENIYTGC